MTTLTEFIVKNHRQVSEIPAGYDDVKGYIVEILSKAFGGCKKIGTHSKSDDDEVIYELSINNYAKYYLTHNLRNSPYGNTYHGNDSVDLCVTLVNKDGDVKAQIGLDITLSSSKTLGYLWALLSFDFEFENKLTYDRTITTQNVKRFQQFLSSVVNLFEIVVPELQATYDKKHSTGSKLTKNDYTKFFKKIFKGFLNK